MIPGVSGTVLNQSQIQNAIRSTSGIANGGNQSYAMTIDLRGTTGDRELDAKIARAGQAILAQVPSAMQNHQMRDG